MIGEIIFYLERGLGKILQVAKGTIDDNRGGVGVRGRSRNKNSENYLCAVPN